MSTEIIVRLAQGWYLARKKVWVETYCHRCESRTGIEAESSIVIPGTADKSRGTDVAEFYIQCTRCNVKGFAYIEFNDDIVLDSDYGGVDLCQTFNGVCRCCDTGACVPEERVTENPPFLTPPNSPNSPLLLHLQ